MSFRGLIAHFFSSLNNILLYRCTSLFTHSSIEDTSVAFNLGWFWRKLLSTFTQRFLCRHIFHWIRWLCNRSTITELLGKVSFFSFVKSCLSKRLYHFAFSPAMNVSSCYSVSLLAFGIASFFNLSHSNRHIALI